MIELNSYTNHGYGMTDSSDWKDGDNKIYSRGGNLRDNVLGIVVGRVSNYSYGSPFTYSAECSYQGRMIYARFKCEKGTVSLRALSMWMTKHAMPAMRKYAMEITK